LTRPSQYAAAAALIGLAVCATDAASKALVVAHLSAHRPVPVLGGLITLDMVRNPGAAFGFGRSYTAIYALVAAGALVAILRVSRRLRSWAWTIALGLLLGGAAGNLLDRVFRSPGLLRGFVVDWIKLPYFAWSFNIADASIVIGVALLVLATIRGWQLDGTRHPSSTHRDRAVQSQDVPPPLNP
jgi:signal peptidase II